MRFAKALFVCGWLSICAYANADTSDSMQDKNKIVVEHQGVSMTYGEFEAILNSSPEKIKRLAAMDLGDRFELINSLMVVRKLAAEAEKLGPEDDGYWNLYWEILGAKENFIFQRMMAQVELPETVELAREYYTTRKDYYALVPEERASSHILLASRPGLDRVEIRQKAQEILDQLRAGAEWSASVAEHSDDPGSASRDGAISRSIALGDASISPPFSGALFDIAEIGEYSDVTDTQFGVHIIRLDGITPPYYREFEEVRDKIVSDILSERRTLASKEIRAKYHLDDDAFIDGAAMEELFEQYKTLE
ncbi:MAG: peptidylprolyl isomerase [Congregibacter sp.]